MICTGRGHEALRHTGLALGSCYSGCDQRHNSARVSGVGGLARARGGTFFRDASRHRHSVFGVSAGEGTGGANSRGSLGRWVYGPNAVWKPTRQVGLVANLRVGRLPSRPGPLGGWNPTRQVGLARTAGWSSLGVWEATRRVEIINHRVRFHTACGNLLAEWRFPTHRRAFSALSVPGVGYVRVANGCRS